MVESRVIHTDVLVVGGGPAGLCAAIEARKCHVDVLLIDDKNKLGGQLIKQTHMFFGSRLERAGVRGIDIANELIAEYSDAGGNTLTNAIAVGFYDDGMVGVLHNNTDFIRVYPKKCIIASGAYENMLPFPNSDLPGVYGAGGFQTLMNIDGVLPGKKVLMVGAGNIGLIVSYQLLQAGGDVVAVIDAAPRVGGYDVHAAKIQRMGVPILLSHTIRSAGGNGKVERATIVRVDENFKEISGTECGVECDAICLAVGLSPLAEALFNAGCNMRFIPSLGGYVAEHDATMKTSHDSMYVAGDISGIEEASAAMVEGKIAGVAAAAAVTGENLTERISAHQEQLARLRKGPFGEKVREGKRLLWGIDSPDTDAGRPRMPHEKSFPVSEGTHVVMECFEEIPCNPCEESCKSHAIDIGDDITQLPQLKTEKCGGCGVCLTRCPGLAIFLVDMEYSKTRAEITIPYEILPVPNEGETWQALDRSGKIICAAEITQVRTAKAFDKKYLVSFTVDKQFANDARHVIPDGKKTELKKIPAENLADDPVICRCEDIRLSTIEEAIDGGCHTFNELKRVLRVGMGPCQGKTCQRIVLQILARKLGGNPADYAPMTIRAPLKPVSFDTMARVPFKEEE